MKKLTRRKAIQTIPAAVVAASVACDHAGDGEKQSTGPDVRPSLAFPEQFYSVLVGPPLPLPTLAEQRGHLD
jgi:hypothetical protein